MGLQLPGELVTVLSMVGFDWPKSDESKLFQLGQSWVGFAGQLQEASATVTTSAERVWAGNRGAAIDAFQQWWDGGESAPAVLGKSSTPTTLLGAGLYVCAAVVLALKIQVIVQLVLLAIQIAQAIATAVATFGASLLEIPVFKMLTQVALDLLIDQVINMLLGG
jgi:hypothetical protein